MKLRPVRTEIEDEIRRQRCFHVQVEHLEPLLGVNIKAPCEQVANQILKESPGCLPVAVFRKVDEAEETCRNRVNDSRDSFGLHRGRPVGGDGFAEHRPLLWLRDEELPVDGPRKLLAEFEGEVFLAGNE